MRAISLFYLTACIPFQSLLNISFTQVNLKFRLISNHGHITLIMSRHLSHKKFLQYP